MNISRKTFEILKTSGWHPERKIDCTGTVAFLKSRGFVVNDKIISLIEEFGNLEFNLSSNFEDLNINRHHSFIKRTIGNLNYGDFKYFQEIFQERVVPVGELFNRHLYILASESGKIYTDIGLAGNDFVEAFDNIIGLKIEKILGNEEFKVTKEHNSSTICVVTDKTRPDILYADKQVFEENEEYQDNTPEFNAFSGIYSYNPSIKPQRVFSKVEQYKSYYKFCLTDAGIDRYIADFPKVFIGKDVERIRTELSKMRNGITKTRDEAKKDNLRASDGSFSFEIWPIEYCAEVWAARNAILSGIKFEDIAFGVIKRSDKGIMTLCNNCKRIFENNYKIID